MEVGLQMVFSSYGWSGVSGGQVWDGELRLARLAADLGFDVLSSVERHFNDYSFCPDNLQIMSYLSAVCQAVDLMGGTCQRHYVHGVPRQPHVGGARVSLTFRRVLRAPGR